MVVIKEYEMTCISNIQLSTNIDLFVLYAPTILLYGNIPYYTVVLNMRVFSKYGIFPILTKNIYLVQNSIRNNTHAGNGREEFVSVFQSWAAIQRRSSVLAWIAILSVYDADTIATDLSCSALIS